MKIIIFGCQAISIEILRYLNFETDHEIAKVHTYEVLSDISRGQESIINVANDLGISISSPSRVSSEVLNEIKRINPDIIISAYYRKIFPKELFDLSKLGVINIHPSLLPYYRGPVPTAWAILKNETEFGITIHKVDSGIDTGDILVQEKYNIDDQETGHELYLRAMDLGAKLLIENFDDIVNQEIKPKKQPPGGSYFGKLKTRVLIDWKDEASFIKNQVRVRAMPYNPIETILENKYFFINKVSIVKNGIYPIQVPGKILKVYDDETFDVSCSNGALHIEEYTVFPPFTGVEKEIYLRSGRTFSNG
jgi:methionyl-tRNA formyltransferase